MWFITLATTEQSGKKSFYFVIFPGTKKTRFGAEQIILWAAQPQHDEDRRQANSRKQTDERRPCRLRGRVKHLHSESRDDPRNIKRGEAWNKKMIKHSLQNWLNHKKNPTLTHTNTHARAQTDKPCSHPTWLYETSLTHFWESDSPRGASGEAPARPPHCQYLIDVSRESGIQNSAPKDGNFLLFVFFSAAKSLRSTTVGRNSAP